MSNDNTTHSFTLVKIDEGHALAGNLYWQETDGDRLVGLVDDDGETVTTGNATWTAIRDDLQPPFLDVDGVETAEVKPVEVSYTPEIPADLSGYALSRVLNEFDREIKIYDDAIGFLWILRDSMGITGIVRASTFEEAHGIAEDELYPEADEETWDAIARECDCADPEQLMDNAVFQESYGFRPNGANSTDKHRHGIYQKDLNGDRLERLTRPLILQLKLRVFLTPWEE